MNQSCQNWRIIHTESPMTVAQKSAKISKNMCTVFFVHPLIIFKQTNFLIVFSNFLVHLPSFEASLFFATSVISLKSEDISGNCTPVSPSSFGVTWIFFWWITGKKVKSKDMKKLQHFFKKEFCKTSVQTKIEIGLKQKEYTREQNKTVFMYLFLWFVLSCLVL